MITEATYTRDGRTATIRVERIDTWVEDTESIVNFPGILELDGRLVLSFARSQHGREHTVDEDTNRVIESYDDGETWQPVPEDYPLVFRDPQTGRIIDGFGGFIGYLRDGTIVHIGHNTQLQHDVGYAGARMHDEFQQDNPTFRFQRASGDGQLLETIKFKVAGMPWGRRSYQVYSPILEMDDGDLLAAMEWCKMLPEDRWRREAHGRIWKYLFGVFIVRSGDGGHSWDYVTQFDPDEVQPVYGISDRSVDDGFDEAHMAKLPNGDILCMLRTGSYSPLWQARSRDGGRTWDAPESTGWPAVKPQLQVLPNGVLACASGRGVLRPPPGDARDDQPRRHGQPLGSAVLLPHRAWMLIHDHHAAGRQVARDLLGLRLHARHGDARAARATHSPRRLRYLDRRLSAARQIPHREHA